MNTPNHELITPGEILMNEFLEPLGISRYRLAKATNLTPTHIGQIARGERRITADSGPRAGPSARAE